MNITTELAMFFLDNFLISLIINAIFDILSKQKENHKIKTNTYSNALKVEDETKADIG